MRNVVRKIWLPLVILIVLFPFGCRSAGDLDTATALTKARNEGKMVMLELGSVGCIPCEQMKPVMAQLRNTYRGRLEVFFIDVNKDSDAARRFGIYMIPTQVFIDRDGKEFSRHIGYFPYEEIVPVLRKAGL